MFLLMSVEICKKMKKMYVHIAAQKKSDQNQNIPQEQQHSEKL